MVVRRYGLDLELTSKSGKQILDSLRIHEIEIENLLSSETRRETTIK